MTNSCPDNLLKRLADRARQADVFNDVRCEAGQLICPARGSRAPAEYAVTFDPDADRLWIVLRTTDRWLSESIEADLMHTGDKLEELIEDELVELGQPMKVSFEHFRDDQRCYTFRSPLALAESRGADNATLADQVAAYLLAYESAFRELGDMSPDDES